LGPAAAALVVMTMMLPVGCRRSPEEPIYSVPVDVPGKTELEYEPLKTLDSRLDKLKGIALDGNGRIYAVGVPGVNVLDGEGKLVGSWKTPQQAWCVAAGEDGTVYVGLATKVLKFDGSGKASGSWGEEGTAPGQFRQITSIAVRGIEVLVADAGNKCVHRFTADGDYSNDLGRRDREANFLGFIVPSPYLDCVITPDGKALVTNPGRARVETYSLDGELESHWGKAGMQAERFCGCCNPTSLALTREQYVVTAEKGIPRVKVYDRKGKMLAFIGPKHFSPDAAGLDLAVDSKGRIYVADPVSAKIHVFALKTGGP